MKFCNSKDSMISDAFEILIRAFVTMNQLQFFQENEITVFSPYKKP